MKQKGNKKKAPEESRTKGDIESPRWYTDSMPENRKLQGGREMKQEFKMEQAEMDDIIKINTNRMPVMLIGGVTTGMDLQEKINAYWLGLENKYGFNKDTVTPSGKGKLYFLAEAKHIDTPEEIEEKKYNTISKIIDQLESCNYECQAGFLKDNVAFRMLKKTRW